MVTFLRPGNGMPPYHMKQISGITTKKEFLKILLLIGICSNENL